MGVLSQTRSLKVLADFHNASTCFNTILGMLVCLRTLVCSMGFFLGQGETGFTQILVFNFQLYSFTDRKAHAHVM